MYEGRCHDECLDTIWEVRYEGVDAFLLYRARGVRQECDRMVIVFLDVAMSLQRK